MHTGPDDLTAYISLHVKKQIEKALCDPLVIARTGADAVEHDNGFIKIVLENRSPDSYGCRVHFWKPGTSDSNIHSHRWNMASFFLAGGYEAAEYALAENGDSFYRYKFIPYEQNDYRLTLQDSVYLKKVATQTYGKGDSYELLKGRLHKVSQVHVTGAVTVVLSWGDEDIDACVFKKRCDHNEVQSRQRKLTAAEVHSYLLQAHQYIIQSKSLLKSNSGY